MRTPIQPFAKQERVSVRYLYNEAAEGRLTLTKVGSRTFVDDEDAAAWRALAPKVTGKRGERELQAASKQIEDLGRAVSEGKIDRAFAAARLAKVARKAGLILLAGETEQRPAA
jgi:hypothetical protein